MRRTFVMLVLAALTSGGPVLAGEHSAKWENKGAYEKKHWDKQGGGQAWQKPSFKAPVVVNDIGFQAASRGGKVAMSWKSYKRADFKYYKVVRSNTNPDPVYPEDGAIKYFDDPSQTQYEDWAQPGTWHYRLCVLTQNGDRWVSPVVTISGEATQAPAAPPSASDFE